MARKPRGAREGAALLEDQEDARGLHYGTYGTEKVQFRLLAPPRISLVFAAVFAFVFAAVRFRSSSPSGLASNATWDLRIEM